MRSRRLRILLVGNGPYYNRGCEAIVRGTMSILRRALGNEIDVVALSYGNAKGIAHDAGNEADPALKHVPLSYARWSKAWLRRQLKRLLVRQADLRYCSLEPYLNSSHAVLKLGGDTYSPDYGLPRDIIDLDREIRRHKIPMLLWGASVGPFDSHPEFAEEMFAHLRGFDGILARESMTVQYLADHGVTTNVYSVCDPAFAMEPKKPDEAKLGFSLSGGTVGFNFSPILAKRVGDGNPVRGIELCAEIVARLSNETGRDIVLITHVTGDEAENDYLVLEAVANAVAGRTKSRVLCAPDNLSAAESKWLISQCAAFAGARTHATIGAFSTCVPTLSFAYSQKARGLNKDIFGTLDYCLEPAELTPETVSMRMRKLLDHGNEIRSHLESKMPSILERAFSAGTILRSIIEERARFADAAANE